MHAWRGEPVESPGRLGISASRAGALDGRHDLHRQALRNRTQVGYHQLRIGIKRFRYMCENFLPQRHAKWAKDLRELQDALGEVHDFDVLKAIKAYPSIEAPRSRALEQENRRRTAAAPRSLSSENVRQELTVASLAR